MMRTGGHILLQSFPCFRNRLVPCLLETENPSTKGIGFAHQEKFREECRRAFVPGVDSSTVGIKSLLRSPKKGERKQSQPDGVGTDALDGVRATDLHELLQMSIGILIRLATERASLHHHDEAGLQVEIHVPYVDLWPNGHIVSRGSSELANSLASHSLEGRWRWYGWFLCRLSFLRSNDSRSDAPEESFWISFEVFRQVETSHALPCSHNKSEQPRLACKGKWLYRGKYKVLVQIISIMNLSRQWRQKCLLVFLNDITRNIIPSNGTEILLVYYGYRVHPQAHGYTIVAFHLRVFQGYRIYFFPREDHVEIT